MFRLKGMIINGLILLLVGDGINLFAADEFRILGEKLEPSGYLRALGEIAKRKSLRDAVYSEKYIQSLRNDEKTLAEDEVSKAKLFIRGMSNIVVLLGKNAFAENDKLALLKDLAIIRDDIIQSKDIGIGNIVLNNALSLTISAIVFDLLHNNNSKLGKMLNDIEPFKKSLFSVSTGTSKRATRGHFIMGHF